MRKTLAYLALLLAGWLVGVGITLLLSDLFRSSATLTHDQIPAR